MQRLPLRMEEVGLEANLQITAQSHQKLTGSNQRALTECNSIFDLEVWGSAR